MIPNIKANLLGKRYAEIKIYKTVKGLEVEEAHFSVSLHTVGQLSLRL